MDTLAILEQKYSEFNRLYFDSKLPTIPIRWGKLKYATAHVGFTTIGLKGGAKRFHGGLHMVFSDKYDRPAETLFPVLLHEMIHVYIVAILDDIEDDHGPVFKRLRGDLMARSGIDIPMTDRVKDFDLKRPVKPVYVVLKYYRGTVGYALISKKTIDEKQEFFQAMFTREAVEVRCVESEVWTLKAENSRIQRILSYKTAFFKAPESDLDDLYHHSRLIWTNRVIKEGKEPEPITYRLLSGPEIHAVWEHDPSLGDRIRYIDIPRLLPQVFLPQPQYGICAFSGNEIVGIAGLENDPDKPNTVWSIYVSVDPAYRRRGIAKKLLQHQYRYIRDHELTLVRSSYTQDGKAFLKPFVDRGGEAE